MADSDEKKHEWLRGVVNANRAPDVTHAKLLAFMMCTHSRLGSAWFPRRCLVTCLPQDILRRIAESFVRMYVVMQNNNKRLMSNFAYSPDVFWLVQHFSIREIGMPTMHCTGLLRRHVTGSRHYPDQSNRPPFAGDPFFARVREHRAITHRHAYVLSNFQRYQDWYRELFTSCRRFSLQFMASDRDYNFLLFEPAFVEYNHAAVPYFTVDGQNRHLCATLRRKCSASLVAQWLRDLWGPGNCERYVRVRECAWGLQIFLCGAEVDPDAILHSNCFNQFRKKMRRHQVLCI